MSHIFINRTEAMRAMLDGKIVKPITPLYLNHESPPVYRWANDRLEWKIAGEWKASRNSFYLASEYAIVYPKE